MVEENNSDPDRYVTYRNCSQYRIQLLTAIAQIDHRLTKTETRLASLIIFAQVAFAVFYYLFLK
jgi:hypothetical protein